MSARIDIPPAIRLLSNDQLRDELKSLSFSPGPIQQTTRSVYERKLYSLQTGQKVAAHSAFPPADSDDDNDDSDREATPPPQKPQAIASSGDRLIKSPSPRKPLHPDMGDYYPRSRTPVTVAMKKPSAASQLRRPGAQRGGFRLPVPRWVIVMVMVVAGAIGFLVYRNLESVPAISIPEISREL